MEFHLWYSAINDQVISLSTTQRICRILSSWWNKLKIVDRPISHDALLNSMGAGFRRYVTKEHTETSQDCIQCKKRLMKSVRAVRRTVIGYATCRDVTRLDAGRTRPMLIEDFQKARSIHAESCEKEACTQRSIL